MKIQALEELKQTAADAYLTVLSLYADIARLSEDDSSLMRSQALFSDNHLGDTPMRPSPYEELAEHTRISFDGSRGFACTISNDKENATGLGERGSVRIELENPDATDWFALELRVPWKEVRAADRFVSSIFFHPSTKLEMRLELFYWLIDGERRSVFKAPLLTQVAAGQECLRFEAEYSLPNEAQIDFDREPMLAFFLDTSVTEYRLKDLAVLFKS